MGRIVYGMMQSLDGYIAGPPAGPALPPPGDALHRIFNDNMKHASAALYGRTMYEIMRFWEDWDSKPEATPVEIDFAHAWRRVPKIVVSKTLKELGPNARLANIDLPAEIARLKSETDGVIEVGGAMLAASLSRLKLIDEYRLYLHPLVLGGGKPFFSAALHYRLLPLGAELLPEDVILLRYAPTR